MITTTRPSRLLAWLLVLALGIPCPSAAQQAGTAAQGGSSGAQPTAGAPFTPEQLEQVAAPVALYPDPLLAQVLMASTYPLEIVQAARFVRDHKDLKGDQLNEALKDQTWDDSVKSLVAFPEVLTLMDGKLDWTQKLGDAFLAQQKDLLDAVQRLRTRAQEEGNLKSTKEQKVTAEAAAPATPGQATQEQVIVIEPADPQVIYVPSYNPTVVYGAWPYPAYPPYYPYPPGYAFGGALLSFGIGIAVGGAIWGNCNWGHGNVDVHVEHYQNYSKNVNRSNMASQRISQVQQGQAGNRAQWNHNPEHRQGVQYRDQGTQQRYNKAVNPQAVQSREDFRGRAEQGRQDRGGGDAGRSFSGGGGREAGAFQGMGSGGDARDFSSRGQASRQSMGGAGGFSGGARPTPAMGGGGGGRGGGGGGGRGGGRR